MLTLAFVLGVFYPAGAQEVIEGLSYLDNKPVAVTIKDGKIVSIKKIRKLKAGNENLYLSPGLIDNQVNGFVGVSFSSEGIPLTEEGMDKATQALWENGVTTYFPTVTTNSRSEIINNFSILAKAKNNPSTLGSIPGFHLEGPYISPVDGYRGAHSLHFVRPPDWEEFMEFYKASDNGILTVTVAPEVEGGLEFIKWKADWSL